jgi:hypothetical protein
VIGEVIAASAYELGAIATARSEHSLLGARRERR